MLDHIGIRARDYARSKAFYAAALAPLGYAVVMEFGPESGAASGAVGLGVEGKPDFWISGGEPHGQLHVAFAANDRRTVDAFYAAALGAGGQDNGKPGLRKEYHPTYYGAFVLDPDGNNIEAVCHLPE